ncbi:hypothetical protein E4U48_001551 [Claviceps purpurea]|nr:hypothetical protein E4U48_001551 [Claviceps purpurea]
MPPLGEIDLNVVQRTPTTVTAPDFLKPKPKRGPKKLRLVDRLYTAPKPITRIERSYSPRTRDSVLMFLIHHRIYDPGHRKSIGGYRNPSQDEASKMFQIPMLTITTWWRKRDEETFKKAVDRIISWPLLENELPICPLSLGQKTEEAYHDWLVQEGLSRNLQGALSFACRRLHLLQRVVYRLQDEELNRTKEDYEAGDQVARKITRNCLQFPTLHPPYDVPA